MPLSLRGRLDLLESEISGDARFVDVALALTRDKTGETLLFAGGVWDTHQKEFTAKDPEKVVCIALEESQVEFTKWFAEFLADYRDGYPRNISAALVAGDRRGGKTFDVFLCQQSALVEVPLAPDGTTTIGWAVSRTYRERDELDQIVANYFPDWFCNIKRSHEHRIYYPHGSYLRNLSADDPKGLKQGRVDFLLYNEPQKMSPKAIENGLYGTADRAGLMMMAANPPDGPEGEWLRDLKEAIDDNPKIAPITRFFNFESRFNTKINQPARVRVGEIAKIINPEGADADAAGSWASFGDLACPQWNKSLIIPLPDVGFFEDVTELRTRSIFGRSFPWIVGGDFQKKPQAGAVMKIIRVPGFDEDIYQFTGAIGVVGTEVELSTELLGAPYSFKQRSGEPNAAMIIGDCSGSWQGSQRIPGRTSFGILESEGWYVQPAEIIENANTERPRNPPVGQRLGLLERLMVAQRIRVDPGCEWLIKSFKRCPLRKTITGTRVPKGQLAHILDAASYAIWRMEPQGARKAPPPKSAMKISIPRPQGIRVV